MEKELYEALKYAYELLNDQAEKGYYPVKALAENGGNGYEPIIKALDSYEKPKENNDVYPKESNYEWRGVWGA